ncbi:hypothetical protein EYE35_01115 [Cereibacter sphaeroides]|nr:hypothetical protein EYE35_01115 [Cereibacter sphaeroides]
MIQASIFETATGRIVRRVLCNDLAEIEVNVSPEESFVLGYYDFEASYVRDGVVIDYPPRPGPWAVFDYQVGAWVDPRTPADLAAELEQARRAGIECINRAADAVRRRYVTAITGQDMLYLRKEAEARNYIAAVDPDLDDYPLIAAEVGITAPTAWQVAQVYLGLSAIWISLAAPLETARLGAIATIETAPDLAIIEATVSAACAAMESIDQGAPV